MQKERLCGEKKVWIWYESIVQVQGLICWVHFIIFIKKPIRFHLSVSLLILLFSKSILGNILSNTYYLQAFNNMKVKPGLQYTVWSIGLSFKNEIFAASATKWCWTWESKVHPGPLQNVIILSNVRSEQVGILVRRGKCSRPPFLTDSLVTPDGKVKWAEWKEDPYPLAPFRSANGPFRTHQFQHHSCIANCPNATESQYNAWKSNKKGTEGDGIKMAE